LQVDCFINLFAKAIPFKYISSNISRLKLAICQKLEYISGKALNSVTRQFVKIEANISTKKAK